MSLSKIHSKFENGRSDSGLVRRKPETQEHHRGTELANERPRRPTAYLLGFRAAERLPALVNSASKRRGNHEIGSLVTAHEELVRGAAANARYAGHEVLANLEIGPDFGPGAQEGERGPQEPNSADPKLPPEQRKLHRKPRAEVLRNRAENEADGAVRASQRAASTKLRQLLARLQRAFQVLQADFCGVSGAQRRAEPVQNRAAPDAGEPRLPGEIRRPVRDCGQRSLVPARNPEPLRQQLERHLRVSSS